ncbi:MAG: ABC-F family ATP-binding cassette domain-containing protein [Hyphomicrobiales bacterium]|nr:ABC-F family ATP-binding cassette domain-containing protein [Hyphomicrobiales bacterium]
MLQIRDLTYRIAGRTLLDGAQATVPDGHKVGLVGRNGSGKTTLFRLILGDLGADGGSVEVRRHARVGTVAQEAPGGPETLIDTVLAADAERAALMAEADAAHDDPAADPHRIAEIHTRLADMDAHAAPARAAAILAGLGFDTAAQARPCADFSGGWRMRVALAAALFAQPDLLLLDEPTNHLDLEATLWLETHLASWRGTLVIISHDRRLLNVAVDEILHLDGGKLTRYAGGYDDFERLRRERQALQESLRRRQEAERQHIQAFVDRFRFKASKARQAQSRLKMLARMEPIASAVDAHTVTFEFPDPSPLAPPLVTLEGAAVGYAPETPVLRGLDLRIDMDDRIALLGANGNGKTTLVRLLAGRLDPMAGRKAASSKLKIGYFAQHQLEELSPGDTPFSHCARLMGDVAPARVRSHLGRFGFVQDKADTRVADLSGGEKARLLFATMSLDAPHVMLLDEPTNHLDVDAREALVRALNDYAGAVILVSHDPHLIELVCDRLWLVAGGTCRPFDGDVDDYRKWLLDQRRGNGEARGGRGGGSKKEARRDRAAQRAERADLRKTLRAAEKEVERLGRAKARLEADLADPKLYDGPADKVTALQIRLAETETALAAAEEAWLAASEALEAAEAE